MVESPTQQIFSTAIDVEQVLKQIAVTAPYFAFEQLGEMSGRKLCAYVKPEQPMGTERGVMAAAEIGRHLAILGSCAAARSNPSGGQHYYLHTKAHLQGNAAYLQRIACNDLGALKNGNLIGIAKAEFTGKRNAKAKVRIVCDAIDEVLYHLDMDYLVLSRRIFERRFGAHHVDDFDVDPHAYRKVKRFDDLVDDVEVYDSLLSARFKFQPSNCAGHFPRYPALPVSVLMFILSKAAGKVLATVTENDDVLYSVVSAEIDADNLAFPDEILHLTVQHEDSDTDARRHSFQCRALSEGKDQHKFGEMKLTLQVNDR